MSSANKQKGTRWEVKVCDYLRQQGFTETFRLAPGGELDPGDVGGLPDWAIEVRDRAKHDLSRNVRDANQRAINKGSRWGCSIMKKRQHPVEDAYVVLDLRTFAEVLKALDR